MCGIVGFVHSENSRPADRDTLLKMRARLAHRGPDGYGEYVTHGAALGHTRLSVIDIALSAQPMPNEDGSVWVTFNGEIYNYKELRESLIDAGHTFRTAGDTEVLVHGYEEWGTELPTKLNGMFAFAILDKQRNQTILARDHFGIKPLFYSIAGGSLVFASEIKALLAWGIEPEVDREALAEYLTFRYMVRPRTFFKGIQSIPAGTLAVWRDGRLSMQEYWSPSQVPSETGGSTAEHLYQYLNRGVSSQLMSDVPLGTFCSGGVDSGVVTAYASNLSTGPLHTFSVGFNEAGWDESVLARKNAARAGSIHHTVTASAADIPALLKKLIWYNDEPLSHPNSVPIYMLSRLAREYVTVVLTGEGADELFCGYPRYRLAYFRGTKLGQWLCGESSPNSALRIAGALLRSAPSRKARRIGELIPLPTGGQFIYNSAYCDPGLVHRLTGVDVDEVLGYRKQILARCAVPDNPIATMSRYEASTYLGCALDRMDRMSMASGLEGRVPFLDMPLAELALSLPASHKIDGTSTKVILKKLAAGVLDPNVVRARKSGFGLPLDDWFRMPAFNDMLATLSDRLHPAALYFDMIEVERIIQYHKEGRHNFGEILWLLSNVFSWMELQEPVYSHSSGLEIPSRPYMSGEPSR